MICRLPPFFVLVVMEIDLPAVSGFRAPPLLGPWRTPGGERGGLPMGSSECLRQLAL